MTDQKYKLVPSPITNKMIERAGRAYDRAGNKPTVGTFLDAIEKAIEAAIDAAPEPVCKWTFVGIGFDSECGWHVEPSHGEYPHDSPYPFCPHCGRKTEVVGNE